LSCAPGSITVSESIRTAVKGKVTASFDDQGTQPLRSSPIPSGVTSGVTKV
jgi:hypothetical protein